MSKNEVSFAVTDEYKSWIDDIKKRIRQAQIKAAIKVNYELLDLYWELGKDIVKKQESTKWGDAFLKTMSKDLQKSFPDLSGLSPQNLKHIRYWYKFYSQGGIGLQGVTQLEDGSGDVPVEPTLQEIEKLIKSIPWGHNQRIMYKCKSINEALFYVQKKWITTGAGMFLNIRLMPVCMNVRGKQSQISRLSFLNPSPTWQSRP